MPGRCEQLEQGRGSCQPCPSLTPEQCVPLGDKQGLLAVQQVTVTGR